VGVEQVVVMVQYHQFKEQQEQILQYQELDLQQ
jgi:hypothetical protein